MRVWLRMIAVLSVALLLCWFALASISPAVPPVSAASCAESPSNLLKNGSMAPGGSAGNGVANWNPFYLSAYHPPMEWVDNEGWDPNGSQYIWADEQAWDAGIYQTVTGLTAGQTYHVWFVWGQAWHEVLGVGNYSATMTRQLGVDRSGGTNAASGNVLWAVPHVGVGGFNRPEWNLTFTATGPSLTVFLRSKNVETTGRNKVWFDVACLYSSAGSPTSTPWNPNGAPTATPTQTPIPTATPPSPISNPRACNLSNVTTINVGAGLKGLATDPSTNRIFAALYDASSVAVINAATNGMTTWSAGNNGHSNGVAAQNGKVFLTMRDTNQVAVLDAATGQKVKDITVGTMPYGIGAANGRVWAANFADATDSVLDAAAASSLARPTGGVWPSLVAAITDRAYISFWGGGIAVLDRSGNLLDTITNVGDGAYGVAADETRNRVWATNRNTYQIFLLDATSHAVLASITAPNEPYAVAFNPATRHLWVSFAANRGNSGDTPVNQVRAYDADTLAELKVLDTGAQGSSGGDGITILNNRVYVANNQAGTISVFSDNCSSRLQAPAVLNGVNP